MGTGGRELSPDFINFQVKSTQSFHHADRGSMWASVSPPVCIAMSVIRGGRDGAFENTEGHRCGTYWGLTSGQETEGLTSASQGEGGRALGSYLTMFHHVVQDGRLAAALLPRSPDQLIGISLGSSG